MALHASPAVAQAKGAEAIARIAQAITVRIEGATQGSGVLVKREGNRYTVLTAWHVVSGQRPGEELDVYTQDNKRHSIEQASIHRIGDADMAKMTFTSLNEYPVALIGDANNIDSGSTIYVSGYPLSTPELPFRIFRFRSGNLEARIRLAIANGLQLLYPNPTLPGMSGGAILDVSGRLIGIHAGAERAEQVSHDSGKAIATGTNQGIPIVFYLEYESVTTRKTNAFGSSSVISQGDQSLRRPQPLRPSAIGSQQKRTDYGPIKIDLSKIQSMSGTPVLHPNETLEVMGPGIIHNTIHDNPNSPGPAYVFNGTFGLHLNYIHSPSSRLEMQPDAKLSSRLRLAVILVNRSRTPVSIRFEPSDKFHSLLTSSSSATQAIPRLVESGLKKPEMSGVTLQQALDDVLSRLPRKDRGGVISSEDITTIPSRSRTVLFTVSLSEIGVTTALLRGRSNGPFEMAVVAAINPQSDADLIAMLDSGRIAERRVYKNKSASIKSRNIFSKIGATDFGDSSISVGDSLFIASASNLSGARLDVAVNCSLPVINVADVAGSWKG